MATVSISGDFAELLKLQGDLDTLGGQRFRQNLNQQLVAASLKLLADEFASGTDPYGRGWKPTTSRDGQTLRDTGRLLNSFGSDGSTTSTRFGIGTALKYAGVHQYGATIVAKTARGLLFKLPFATRVFSARGAKLKRAQVLSNWVTVQKVTIPQRQMMPEGDLGPTWTKEFTDEADAALLAVMGK